jgi:integrase
VPLHNKPLYDTLLTMDITKLIKSNRLPKKQRGQLIETPSAFYVRYYITAPATEKDAARLNVAVGGMIRKQTTEKLADRSDLYRSATDVQPLLENVMARVNADITILSGQASLTEYVETVYLPWAKSNKAAATHDGYRKVWEKYIKPLVGKIALANLSTVQVTRLLTHHAEQGKGRATLAHMKWMLSGVYEHAIATGVVPKNPVSSAKPMKTVEAPDKQMRYSLEQVLAMLRILEPLDVRAAVALGLAYFAALRPAEIRGLQWTDVTDHVLHIRRKVWRKEIGKLKTEQSADTVPLIEPLRSLLEKLRAQSVDGFILQNGANHPLDVDSLSTRVIAPAMAKAGIDWRGYYPARRGYSSVIAELSKNPLHGAAILRNSLETNLKHYTEVSAEAKAASAKLVEQMALAAMAKSETETVQ